MGWKEMQPLDKQVASVEAEYRQQVDAAEDRFKRRVASIAKNMLLVPKLLACGLVDEWDDKKPFIYYLGEFSRLDQLKIDLHRRDGYGPGEFVALMRRLREVLGPMKVESKDTYGLHGRDLRFELSPTGHPDVDIVWIDSMPEGAKCRIVETVRMVMDRSIVCEK